MNKLTDKQENFAVAYTINGGNATEAYREHYDVGEDTKEATVWRSAHELLKTPKVSARVHDLRMAGITKNILSIEERKQLLTGWALDGSDKAIEILNKMEGVYVEKQKVELTGADGKPVETKWTVEFKDTPNE